MRFVQRNRLFHSSYFRFALLLTVCFALAYLISLVLALNMINIDLGARVDRSVAHQVRDFEVLYQRTGLEGVQNAVEVLAQAADPEDETYWLGTPEGEFIAGHPLASWEDVSVGNVDGTHISGEPDDLFHVAILALDDYRLVVAYSYEEAEQIRGAILFAFGFAALLTVILASLAGYILSRRGQARMMGMVTALDDFAGGDMTRRIETRVQGGDDLHDVAARINQALDRLQDNVQGIRQVSTDIAHDMRTPITHLGIELEDLRTGLMHDPSLAAQVDAASQQVRDIASSFDALLSIARLEARADPERCQWLDLADIAHTLYESYLVVVDDNAQRLTLSIPASGPFPVFADRDLLMQMGVNLIENCVRHCPTGIEITLSVGSHHDECWLEVKDNGPGIPHEEQSNIFKRFYRLQKSRTSKGSGLGMAIVKAVADYHKARIDVRDGAPGLAIRIVFNAAP